MARFDVYRNSGSHAAATPFLLDVQCSLLEDMDSTMVIPMRSVEHFAKVKLPTRLIPVFTIDGKNYLLETPKMGAVPRRILKDRVTSLVNEQARITAALDFLFQGY